MKTKKVVVGAIAATMLSLSVCSLAPVAAAGETVQISVGKASAEVGSKFSVDVSLADIPSSGIQALDFAITYDSSALTIDSVEAGALINKGVDKADLSASLSPCFESSINKTEGYVSLIWSTATDDASYWLKGNGVYCTINGTVASGAKNGTYDLKITPIERETFYGSKKSNATIGCGYESNGKPVKLDVKTSDGSVTVGKIETTTTTIVTQGPTATKRGDANCDGEVDMSDIVLIMQSLANPNKYGVNGSDEHHITAVGEANADVDSSSKGVTNGDAAKIQKWLLKSISEL
uniref:Scaffoldin C n=1 Tax=Ruminococcus flavefaciens TaxID=1265 RepID=A0A0A7P0I2_RUMFL|nr:scaffoldin C [Ruminococcus flavefaciens]